MDSPVCETYHLQSVIKVADKNLPQPYHRDKQTHQVYYIDACNEQDAIALMQQMYPDDEASFTVELCCDTFVEPEPDHTKLYLYRMYRKSEFMFLDAEPLAEEWATEAEVAELNTEMIPQGLVLVKAQD